MMYKMMHKPDLPIPRNPVASAELVQILRQGPGAFEAWRASHLADLIDLEGAQLEGATLSGCNLSVANIRSANLRGALCSTVWGMSHSREGGVRDRVWMRRSSFAYADMSGANLQDANLVGADFEGTNLEGADLRGTTFAFCDLVNTNFKGVRGLEQAQAAGPSRIDARTMASLWDAVDERIANDFMLMCGYPRWEVTAMRLHDPRLKPAAIADLGEAISRFRSEGLGFGVFISYARADAAELAEALRQRFRKDGNVCWLDDHDMTAGPMDEQLRHGIGRHDAVVLILSEAALMSEWVNRELSMARERERKDGRFLLCPIAVDSSWKDPPKAAAINRALLEYVKGRYHVMDFSEWKKPDVFEKRFLKMDAGLRKWYAGQT